MKKQVFFVILAAILTFSVEAEAAPAFRGPYNVKQSDGTELTIELFGDEHCHWAATIDGAMVVSTAKGYYVAEIDNDGCLTPTDMLAHNPEQRGSLERAVVSRQVWRRSLFFERREELVRRAALLGDSDYLQHTGSPHILTVLLEFQDVRFTINDPIAAYDQYLNGETLVDMGNKNKTNLSSVRKYFETCSGGQFVPQFDIVGPVVLPDKMAVYGEDSDKKTDINDKQFHNDIFNALKDLVKDWSVYDNNGDGGVELVCFIYAGYGQNLGAEANTLWAKASRINYQIDDRYHVVRVNRSPELFVPQYADMINGTGVFIHEFSHCMGLPDLYPTKSKAYVHNQGMGSYSIMDYGLYTNSGYAPTPYNAWEQEVLGWKQMEKIELKDGAPLTVSNVLPLLEGGKAYKLVNGDYDNEYIVMENVQARGLNAKGYGHGLLVYHVDYPFNSVNMSDSPNNNPGHPAVAVVPACGISICSVKRDGYTWNEWLDNNAAVTFPGTSVQTSLTDQMNLPNFCFFWMDENDQLTPISTGFMLSDIAEDAETGTVSFCVAKNEATGIANVMRKTDNDATWYDLQGRKLLGTMKPGVYIKNGRAVMIK